MTEHNEAPLIFNMKINSEKYASAPQNEAHCPFCAVDSLTNIFKIEGHKIWLKNKFPTIENSMMTVIIESDKHLGDVSSYSLEENREVFRFAFDCWDEMIDSKKYQSVLMFKNFGPRSGGTLRHPHMQIVGLEQHTGYEQISPENFKGVEIKENGVIITLSTQPIMGLIEFNVIISDLADVENLADSVHLITNFLLTEYMNGRCDSYNLFFHHVDGQYICKIVPRFITSPYYIGYKIPQVSTRKKLEELAEILKEKLSK